MTPTVAEILAVLREQMPFELAEEWDNIGLLAGSRSAKVTRVLCALDLTGPVLDEAVARGAQMLVTHHPILFRGRKNLCEDDPAGALLAKLIRSGCALVAMHTNFDAAQGGVNDVLAGKLGLSEVQALEGGLRVGRLEAAVRLEDFSNRVSGMLGGVVRRYGAEDFRVSRVAVLGGAGGSYSEIARAAGADAFVTGEIGYHMALDNWAAGLASIEAGHAATERPAIVHLKDGLQNRLDALQYKVEIIESAVASFL